MHRILQTVKLKSGETAEVWKITAPDHKWREQLLKFLDHKGERWIKPMDEALRRGIDGLTMNFYECVLDGEIIANVTVVEALEPPVGLLQHVFTTPEHRRKGAAKALLQAIVRDFRLRGGQAMHLNTGYKSVPFWIYHSVGFRSVAETGHMRWLGRPDFMERFFAPAETRVEDVAWRHWPLLDALYGVEAGWVLRDLRHRLYWSTGFEGQLVSLMWGLAEGEVRQARVLVSEKTGAVVGLAFIWVQGQYYPPPEPLMLEFFVHPNFMDQAEKLLGSMFFPPGRKIQAVCDNEAYDRDQLLEKLGMWREGTFRRQFRLRDRWFDVHWYSNAWAPE